MHIENLTSDNKNSGIPDSNMVRWHFANRADQRLVRFWCNVLCPTSPACANVMQTMHSLTDIALGRHDLRVLAIMNI